MNEDMQHKSENPSAMTVEKSFICFLKIPKVFQIVILQKNEQDQMCFRDKKRS